MNRILTILLAWTLASAVVLPVGLAAAPPDEATAAETAAVAQGERKVPLSPLRLYVHSFEHREASDAAQLIRHRLSPRGGVEVQPGTNTLVVRDIDSVIRRARYLIENFDVAPSRLRLDVQVIQAGDGRAVISPPSNRPSVDPALTSRLRKLFRYENYDVVARTELSAREGEEVDYALGERFALSFQIGDLVGERRLRVEDFRVVERAPRSTDKSRRPDPRNLFDAHLNLWLDRPFTLVLTQDEERDEALLIVVTVKKDPTQAPTPQK